MTPPTLTRLMLRTMLAELIAATPTTPGPLEIAHLHLCKNAIAPTPDTLLTDFIEADFDGYAAATLTWGTVYSDAAGNSHVPGGLAEYVCTGSTHPNTIYGAYATNAGGTTLLWSYVFDTPVNVAVLGDAVLTTPELVLTDPAT